MIAAVYILAVLLILFGLGLFLKRHVLNRHPLPTAAQQAGLAAMELFQNPEQRQVVEELEYTKKDWTDEAAAGDDIGRYPRKRHDRTSENLGKPQTSGS